MPSTAHVRAPRRVTGVVHAVAICVLLSLSLARCVDEPTGPGDDLASLQFTLTGDSVVVLGGTTQLAAALPADRGVGPSHLHWSSGDTSIALVDTAGSVRGLAVGPTEIIARLVAPDVIGEVRRTKAMEVVYAAIVIEPIDSLTGLGEARDLIVRGEAQGGTAQGTLAASFTTNDTNVVSVTPTGTVTALHNGDANITATYEGLVAELPVKVRQVAKVMDFPVPQLVLTELQRDTVVPVGVRDTRDSLVANPVVAWASSDTSTIKVTSGGVIRAVRAGSAIVTAQTDTASAELPVLVSLEVDTVLVSAGDGQLAPVATAVAVAPSVIVLDESDDPIPGALVTFAVTGGAGQITNANQFTNSSGIATVGSWTLGTAVGVNMLSASSGDQSVSFTATGTPGPPSRSQSIVTVSRDTIGVAEDAVLTIETRDSYGNPLTNGGHTVLFTASGGTSTGTIGATTDVGDGTYRATFTGATAGTATTIGAMLNGVPVTSLPPRITVVQTVANIAVADGDGQTAQVAAAVPVAPAVIVTDGAGNPMAGVGVTFSVTSGGGQIADSVQVTDISGVATLGGWTLGTVAGANSLSATTGTVSTTVGANGMPGPVSANTSSVTVSEDTVAAGGTATLTLFARDGYGNRLTGGGLAVLFFHSGGTSTGAIGSTTDQADGAYTAVFSGEKAGTATSIGATIGGVPVTSPPPSITVVPGLPSLSRSIVAVSRDTIGVAEVAVLSLETRDSYDNPVTNGGHTVVFTASGGTSAGAIGSTTDVGNGTYTATFTGETAGTATTIGALLNGGAVTSSLPSITVVQFVVGITVAAGDGQVAEVGFTVPTAPAVAVQDGGGNPIAGVTVTFSVVSGDGQIADSVQVTDAAGVATLGSWTLGTVAGPNTLIAATGALSTTVSATAVTGPASPSLSVISVSQDTVLAGGTSTLTLEARDGYGNRLASGGLVVVFSYSGGSSAGTIGPVTDNGDGSYTAVFTGEIVGSAVSIGATIDGSQLTSPQPSVVVVPGLPSQVQSIVTVSRDTIGVAEVAVLTLETRDSYGNPLTGGGHTVLFTASGGTSTGTIGATTDVGDGTYTATFTGEAWGTATSITATLNGGAVMSPQPDITVIQLSVEISVIAGDGQSADVGTTVPIAPAVVVRDGGGNPIAGESVTFALVSGGGQISDSVQVTDASGVATLGSWTLGTVPGANAVTASTGALSTTINATGEPGPVSMSSSVVSVSGDTVTAGGTSLLTLEAKDQYGNPLTSGGLTVLFSYGGGTSGGTIGPVTDNGDGTYAAVFTGLVAGSGVSIGSTIGGSPVTSVQPSVTVVPGSPSPAQSIVTVSEDSIGVAEVAGLVLETRDAYGNPLSGGGHTVVFTASGGSSTGTISGTTDLGDGTYTATFTGVTGGTATTMGATLDGSAVTSSLPSITVIQIPVEITVTDGDGQTVEVATAVPVAPAVVVRDGGGNPVAGVTVTFAVASGGGQIADSVQVTDASGAATLGSWILGTVAGANQLTASAGALATTVNATGFAGPASFSTSVVSVSEDTVVAGSTSLLTLQVKDAYGNDLTSGGLTVVFFYSGGGSAGAIGPTTDGGDGTYTAVFTGETAGSATSVGATIDGSPVTSPQPSITVVPGIPAQLTIIAGNDQSTVVGTRVPVSPAVEVRDAFSNVTPGIAVIFTVTSGGGSVTGSPAITDSTGVAVLASWSLGTTPGLNTLSATAASLQQTFNATGTTPIVDDSVMLGNLLLGAEPYRLALSTDNNEIYVANRSSSYITVIDALGDTASDSISVGGSPVGIAVHETTNRVYVASDVVHTVTVLDGTTHNVIATIALGETPAGVAIDEGEDRVYVALPGSDRVAVIDPATNLVIDWIAVGVNPQWLAVDVANHRLFVSNTDDSTVTVIDTQVPEVKATRFVGANPAGIAVNKIRKRAFVATASGLVEFDKESDKEPIPLPPGDHRGVAVDDSTRLVYIANATTNEVVIVDEDAKLVVGTAAVNAGPTGVALHPNLNRVYVAATEGHAVTVLTTPLNIVQAVIHRVGGPRDVAMHQGLNRVYVTNALSDNVSIIDGSSHAVIGDPIHVGTAPWGAAVNEPTGRIYVANNGDGTVTVLDATFNSVVASVGVGSGPRGLVVNGVTNRIYVANHDANTVSVIDGLSHSVVATVPVGNQPTDVAVDTADNIIYVSHESDQVWEIDGVSNTVTGTIGPIGGESPSIELNGVTRLLFVPNGEMPGAVWRLDAMAGSVLGSVSIGGVPGAVGVDQARDLVTVPTTTAVHFLIGSTGTVVHSLPVGTASEGVAVNSGTGKAFVADPVSHSIVIIRY